MTAAPEEAGSPTQNDHATSLAREMMAADPSAASTLLKVTRQQLYSAMNDAAESRATAIRLSERCAALSKEVERLQDLSNRLNDELEALKREPGGDAGLQGREDGPDMGGVPGVPRPDHPG
jgi:predicted RNase H-like nuclease (RuvC/YqgF family)